MELHQLRYFVSVVETGSFTRAAKNCYIAQPSLSSQVHKLEEELGHKLFERLGRGVRLTSAGRAFYARAVSILSAVAAARDSVQDPHSLEEGQIHIGAIPTVAPYLLPRLVRRFTRRYRRAEVTVHEDFTENLIGACVSGEVDLGLVALPIDDDRVSVEPLFSEELFVALVPGHLLLKQRRITLEKLTRERFVLLSEIHCLGAQIVRFCEREGCMPALTCRSAQLMTVQELVALGQGVSLVPEMAARADRTKRIAYRPVSGPRPSRTLAMIWHKHRYMSPLVQGLIGVVRREAGKTAAQRPRLKERRRFANLA
ncbi:MAG TPA: LysR family transcriptional regulator [Candidatus Acidoferrales bacterium]|nr:LysR family transcriptional regulator [Candidatus Acidoferrales bacterium]